MNKYWKRPATLTVIVLLVFMMTLPLTACQIEIPGIGTVNIKDSDLPNNSGNMSGDDGGDDVDGVNTEGDWLLTDGGKFLGLTMTRTSGRQYKKGEASTSVEGAFRIQVPEAFDIVPVLNISEGAKGERLPIQQIPNELLMFNPSQG